MAIDSMTDLNLSVTMNTESPSDHPVDQGEISRLLDGVYDEDADHLHELYKRILEQPKWKVAFLAESRRRAKEFLSKNNIEQE